jgi:hypothetical protein
LRDLVNVLDARIKQLEEQGGAEEVSPEAPAAEVAPTEEPEPEGEAESTSDEADSAEASAEEKE